MSRPIKTGHMTTGIYIYIYIKHTADAYSIYRKQSAVVVITLYCSCESLYFVNRIICIQLSVNK